MAAVFITFPGNCKRALTFYQTCFGGTLNLSHFNGDLKNYDEVIVSGSLFAEAITIHGSDLVPDAGRKLGNYMAVFVECQNFGDRMALLKKLGAATGATYEPNQSLIEITDLFDVHWVLAVNGK